MKKAALVTLTVLLLIGLYLFTPFYRVVIKITHPSVVFLNPVDSYALAKHAMESYFRNDPTLCDRLHRPYQVLLPEIDIKTEKQWCKEIARDIGRLEKSYQTKSAKHCPIEGSLASDVIIDNGTRNLCKDAAAGKELKNLIPHVLRINYREEWETPRTDGLDLKLNSACESVYGCEEYTENLERLMDYYTQLKSESARKAAGYF